MAPTCNAGIEVLLCTICALTMTEAWLASVAMVNKVDVSGLRPRGTMSDTWLVMRLSMMLVLPVQGGRTAGGSGVVRQEELSMIWLDIFTRNTPVWIFRRRLFLAFVAKMKAAIIIARPARETISGSFSLEVCNVAEGVAPKTWLAAVERDTTGVNPLAIGGALISVESYLGAVK